MSATATSHFIQNFLSDLSSKLSAFHQSPSQQNMDNLSNFLKVVCTMKPNEIITPATRPNILLAIDFIHSYTILNRYTSDYALEALTAFSRCEGLNISKDEQIKLASIWDSMMPLRVTQSSSSPSASRQPSTTNVPVTSAPRVIYPRPTTSLPTSTNLTQLPSTPTRYAVVPSQATTTVQLTTTTTQQQLTQFPQLGISANSSYSQSSHQAKRARLSQSSSISVSQQSFPTSQPTQPSVVQQTPIQTIQTRTNSLLSQRLISRVNANIPSITIPTTPITPSATNLTFTGLNRRFYNFTNSTILEPSPINRGMIVSDVRVNYYFNVQPSIYERVVSPVTRDRYAVMLTCHNRLDPSQTHVWPPIVKFVFVNNSVVPIQHVNNKEAMPMYIRKELLSGKNQVTLKLCDGRESKVKEYDLEIKFVGILDKDEVWRRIVLEQSISKEDGYLWAMKTLGLSNKEEDDDLIVTSTTINLQDPITLQTCKFPVRTVTCRHVECFDFETFMHARTVVTKCPICKARARFDDLRYDLYMKGLVETARKKDLLTFEKNQSGEWVLKELEQKEVKQESIEIDDDVVEVTKSSGRSGGGKSIGFQKETRESVFLGAPLRKSPVSNIVQDRNDSSLQPQESETGENASMDVEEILRIADNSGFFDTFSTDDSDADTARIGIEIPERHTEEPAVPETRESAQENTGITASWNASSLSLTTENFNSESPTIIPPISGDLQPVDSRSPAQQTAENESQTSLERAPSPVKSISSTEVVPSETSQASAEIESEESEAEQPVSVQTQSPSAMSRKFATFADPDSIPPSTTGGNPLLLPEAESNDELVDESLNQSDNSDLSSSVEVEPQSSVDNLRTCAVSIETVPEVEGFTQLTIPNVGFDSDRTADLSMKGTAELSPIPCSPPTESPSNLLPSQSDSTIPLDSKEFSDLCQINGFSRCNGDKNEFEKMFKKHADILFLLPTMIYLCKSAGDLQSVNTLESASNLIKYSNIMMKRNEYYFTTEFLETQLLGLKPIFGSALTFNNSSNQKTGTTVEPKREPEDLHQYRDLISSMPSVVKPMIREKVRKRWKTIWQNVIPFDQFKVSPVEIVPPDGYDVWEDLKKKRGVVERGEVPVDDTFQFSIARERVETVLRWDSEVFGNMTMKDVGSIKNFIGIDLRVLRL